MFIRILTGLSLAGIYVIMESWLNEKSTNQTRGQLLSVYMIITFVFVGAGQFLLNLGDPAKVDLFVCWPGEAGGPPPPWLLAKEPGPPLLPFLGPVVGATTPRGFALLTPVGPITDDCGGGFKF